MIENNIEQLLEPEVAYEPYILNDNNMSLYLKYKLINTPNKSISKFEDEFKNQPKKQIIKQSIFFPKETDSLFWCYFIISSGESHYEMITNKNYLVAKQMKINYVDKIRKNKQVVKTYKFDTITNLESNLANDNNINIKTVMTLCAIDKINIIFINKNTYYELIMNDTERIYIIREMENQSKYSKKYGFEIADLNLVEEIKMTLYKIETLDKPIKALSYYKLQDLIDICNKLAIEIKCSDTGKNKTKNELYESVIQYF
jgi:hypothetical protein